MYKFNDETVILSKKMLIALQPFAGSLLRGAAQIIPYRDAKLAAAMAFGTMLSSVFGAASQSGKVKGATEADAIGIAEFIAAMNKGAEIANEAIKSMIGLDVQIEFGARMTVHGDYDPNVTLEGKDE